MIKLKKNTPPTIKDGLGNCKLVSESSDICYKYDLIPDEYNDGLEKFDFEKSSYKHPDVKKKLIRDQNGKCAFCEQNIVSVSYGDVEHFRPKGGYSQNTIDYLHKPGYYWLATDWDNLMLVCQICNQRNKKNLFPLLNPERRALCHHDNINLEKPFFINPYKENPTQLIGFRKEVAYGKDKRHRGKKTIESIGLNRTDLSGDYKDLLEERRDYLAIIEQSYKISKKAPGGYLSKKDIQEAKEIVENSRNKNSRFSSMIIENCG